MAATTNFNQIVPQSFEERKEMYMNVGHEELATMKALSDTISCPMYCTEVMDNKEETLKTISEEWEKGNIVYNTPYGLRTRSAKEIVRQSVEEILYLLHKDPATLYTSYSMHTVNDAAMANVVRYLYGLINEKNTSN